jgi:hypothetical protein
MSSFERRQIEGHFEEELPRPPRTLLGLILLVLLLSLIMPVLAVLLSQGGPSIPFLHIPSVVWGLWAVCSLWVILDAASLLQRIGLRVDPFGPEALGLSGLGAVNVISALVALFLSKP